MAQRGRPPSAKTLVDRQLGRNTQKVYTGSDDTMIIPNLSGDHSAGNVQNTPTADTDIPNKKYIDDRIAAGTAAGQMTFWDGGTWVNTETSELVWDDTNKRLGIGVAAPADYLHINDSVQAGFGVGMQINNERGQINDLAHITFGVSTVPGSFAKGAVIFKQTDSNNGRGELHFAVDTNTDSSNTTISDSKMMIDYDGEVGIGNTAPNAKLHLTNATTNNGIAIAQSGTLAANKYGLLLTASANNQNSGSNVMRIQSSNANSTIPTVVISEAGTGAPLQILDGANTSFIVKDGGNTGIGVESPEKKLDVDGIIQARDYLQIRYGLDPGSRGWFFNPDESQFGDMRIDTESSKGGARLTRMYFDPSGRVGVGNVKSPKSQLDVEGNCAIGAGYSGTTAAPTNGLIVQGNVGIGTNTPTAELSVNEKAGMSALGGHMIKLTNKTGAASVQGEVVEVDPATDDSVILCTTNSTLPIGVFLESGVADGSEAWIVVGGICDIKADSAGFTRGDRLVTSAVGVGLGRATTNNAPAVAVHFQEIGHAIETAAANALGRCVLHFL